MTWPCKKREYGVGKGTICRIRVASVLGSVDATNGTQRFTDIYVPFVGHTEASFSVSAGRGVQPKM